jgi:hypothetical protein
MKLFIVPLAAAAIALTAAPALAKSKKHRTYHHQYSQSYQPGWHGGGYGPGYRGGWYGGGYGGGYGLGFVGRNVSDPSFVSPGYVRNQSYGRCVEDLGYGRYEYCGW